jgi:site-specific recombinase XerD
MAEFESTLPHPKDLYHHLSRSTRARQLSSIKQFYKYFAIPGIGQLAGGEHIFLDINHRHEEY